MNNVQKEPSLPLKTGALDQFRPPLCYELVGKTFDLVMDNGYDYELKFIDKETLSYGKVSESKKVYEYDCLKGDDTTFFVNLEMVGETPRTGLTFILDTEQSLVTVEYIRIGVNPRLPKLPVTEIIFGAIKKEDGTIPRIRHGFTNEMVGKAIDWNYGNFSVVHIYSSERYYRLTMNREEVERRRAANPEAFANRQAMDASRVYEEPSEYIKIKDGLYVFSMTELQNCITRGQGNNLLFLMNLNRMYDVGRSFGYNGEGNPENYTYGAYGQYYDASDLLARKSTDYIR